MDVDPALLNLEEPTAEKVQDTVSTLERLRRRAANTNGPAVAKCLPAALFALTAAQTIAS